MVGIWFLLLSYVIQLICVMTTEDERFTSLAIFAGQIWSTNVITSTGMASLTLCGMKCILDGCASFTYDVTDGSCVTYSTLMCDTIGATVKTTALYFSTKFQDGCLVADPVGVKNIQLLTGVCVQVLCDSSGYTVSQKRFDGSENFNRTWLEYKNGFGDANGELWMGNDLLHYLTSVRPRQLRVEMENWLGEQKYAEYTVFSVANETDNYRLTLSGFSGDVLDMFSGMHNGQEFSTVDVDNDGWLNGDCAEISSSGWWYGMCYTCNLNGLYVEDTGVDESNSLVWFYFTPGLLARPLKKSKMMFK